MFVMTNTKYFQFVIAIITCIVSCILISYLFKYISKRVLLNYYALQFSGPFAWPIVGSMHLFRDGYNEFYKSLAQLFASQPPIFKFWLGQDLVIVTSRSSDIETILNKCLEKSKVYNFFKEMFRDGLITEPVMKWKVHRKIINPTFNSKTLNSFVKKFNHHAGKLVKTLESNCEGNYFDLLPVICQAMFDTSLETLGDLDADLIKERTDFFKKIFRMEEIVVLRVIRLWLHPDIIFKHSSLGKEFARLAEETFNVTKQIINVKKNGIQNEINKPDEAKEKRFLNYLFQVQSKQNSLTDYDICEETQTMFIASSESTAITISMILMVLAIRPDILKNVHEELKSIYNPGKTDITLEDINKMKYLESVIKETMRMFPTIPAIMRTVEENVELDDCVIPAGSYVVIPMMHMNRRPEVWKEPNIFNPNRFLSQNGENSHRCDFIPFSYGVRNCIGFKYAMMSMKIILSTILNNFTFEFENYKSLEEIEFFYIIVTKPKHGFKFKMRKINL